MTVIEHLTELRSRLIICIASVGVGAILGWIFYDTIFEVLKAPLDESNRIGDVKIEGLNVLGITTAFTLKLKISVFAGFVFALPFTLYQLWRFITPGLHPKEKRFAIPFVLCALLLFGVGAWLAFQLMPVGISFLLGFAQDVAEPLITLQDYLNFVILMVLAFGISFEFPLGLVFLGLLGILPSRALAARRRMAFLLAFLVAALATPSGDPLSQTILAIPLYILYEISILVIRFGLKK